MVRNSLNAEATDIGKCTKYRRTHLAVLRIVIQAPRPQGRINA